MSKTQAAGKWNVSFSWLRSFACIAIVVLHTMSYSLVAAEAHGYAVSEAQRIGVLLTQYACLWAVPVFVMVTGALLLDPARDLSWGHLRSRYIGRVGKALLVFGALFIAFDLAMNGITETANNSSLFAAHPVSLESPTVTSWLYVILCSVIDLLTGHSWPHMWYLYMLLGLYLLMPFFRKIVANSTVRELRYLIGVLFIFVSVVPLLGLFGISTDYRFSVATVYPLYLLLGYAIQNRLIVLPKWVLWFGIAMAATGIWMAASYYYDDSTTRSFVTSYNSLHVVILSTCLFSLTTQREEKSTTAPKALLQFDKCTFGIYLLHFVFVKLLLRYAGWNPFEQVWLFPVIVLVVLTSSFLLTFVIHKVMLCGRSKL